MIKYVAQSTNNTLKDTDTIVGEFLEYIKKALHEHEEVVIHGFGKFSVKERAARTARNPRTGETIEVPAKYAVTFKPHSALKGLVNE